MGEGGKVFQKSWFLNLTSPQTVGIVLSVSVIGAVVARFPDTEEVASSNLASPTKKVGRHESVDLLLHRPFLPSLKDSVLLNP